MKRILPLSLLAFLFFLPARADEVKKPKVLRAGLIGLDTSHVIAFTQVFNHPKNEELGVRIVAGFPGGSPDVPESANRVKGFTKELQEKHGVDIVDSIEDLLQKVDVVLLESVDGRPHYQQVIPVLKAGKLCFIDKPIAGSLADCLRIFALSRETKTPIFSSSSLRYYPNIAAARKNDKIGDVLGCLSYGPCSLQKDHPDLFWYGVHGVETLYTIMGTGCKSVVRTQTKDYELATGTWDDGRIGSFRGIRKGKSPYGALVFGSQGVVNVDGNGSYEPLVKEIAKFFHTGVPPVAAEETIEMFAFMEAADESKRQGGAPVTIESVLQKARKAIDKGK